CLTLSSPRFFWNVWRSWSVSNFSAKPPGRKPLPSAGASNAWQSAAAVTRSIRFASASKRGASWRAAGLKPTGGDTPSGGWRAAGRPLGHDSVARGQHTGVGAPRLGIVSQGHADQPLRSIIAPPVGRPDSSTGGRKLSRPDSRKPGWEVPGFVYERTHAGSSILVPVEERRTRGHTVR